MVPIFKEDNLRDTQGRQSLAADPRGGIEDFCAVLLIEPCPQPLPENQVADDGWNLGLDGHELGLTGYHWSE